MKPWVQKSFMLTSIVLMLMTTACTNLLSQSESVQLHILRPVMLEPTQQVPLPKWPVINVNTESSPRFDSNRMLLLSGDTELQPVKGVRWASYLPELLAETWANSLEASHLAALTQVDSEHYQAPTLNIHIRDFQAELAGNGQIICRVRLTLALKIPGESNAEIRQFSQQNVVAQPGSGGIAHSFNLAHEQIMLEALEWISTAQTN